ncbi:MAG: TolC family protein [Limisphaerales bacterium]
MIRSFHFIFPFVLAGVLLSNAQAQTARRLTLEEAKEIALKHHPRITVAELRALAAQQAAKEVRAGFFPTASINVTAAGADSSSTRIAAGAINNPTVFERNAEGITISQLITDFGRTWDLSKTAKLRAQAERMNSSAAREQILLEVNAAYFSALESQDVLRVAEETAKSRQLFLNQVASLATNKLKSELDVSFARVDYEQARLLRAKASNDLQAAFATLSTLLGEREPQVFLLVDQTMPKPIKEDAHQLLQLAMQQRPDLAGLRYQRDAAKEFALAERKVNYPTISAIAVGGLVPVGDPRLPDRYAAAGVNLNIPLFSGGLYQGRKEEASLRAKAADEALRDEENNISRQVQISKLNADYAYERVGLTEQLLKNARQAFGLAQTRFKLGSSSIVELSQAELNRTSAEIAQANAKYDYMVQRAALDFQIGDLH